MLLLICKIGLEHVFGRLPTELNNNVHGVGSYSTNNYAERNMVPVHEENKKNSPQLDDLRLDYTGRNVFGHLQTEPMNQIITQEGHAFGRLPTEPNNHLQLG
jgi:hypothetical protein